MDTASPLVFQVLPSRLSEIIVATPWPGGVLSVSSTLNTRNRQTHLHTAATGRLKCCNLQLDKFEKVPGGVDSNVGQISTPTDEKGAISGIHMYVIRDE